jgi:hypothetical protein
VYEEIQQGEMVDVANPSKYIFSHLKAMYVLCRNKEITRKLKRKNYKISAVRSNSCTMLQLSLHGTACFAFIFVQYIGFGEMHSF